MLVSVSFFTKTFKGSSNKDAYLNVCKWIAKNVLNDESKIKETFWKIEREDIGVYKLTLYCTLDYKDRERKFCESCQKYHKRFYYNEDRDCSRCNLKAFKKRIDENLSIKRNYRKELVKKETNGDGND